MTLRWVPGWNGLTEPEAVSYVAAVEAADGQELEFGVAKAINDFVLGCKNDGIWGAIKASCILAGARTLAGALVPLVGAAPTNVGFVTGDYNRKTGLIGDGSSKYLNSNRNNNADPQDSQHMSVWATTAATSTSTAFPIYIGAGPLGIEATIIGRLSSNGPLYFRSRGDDYDEINPGSAVGLIGLSRSSSSFYTSRVSGVNANQDRTSQVPSDRNIFVFAANANPDRPSNARLAFYSIGESLDLAKLDTRVTRLMNLITYTQTAGLPDLSTMDMDAAAYIGGAYRAGGTLS